MGNRNEKMGNNKRGNGETSMHAASMYSKLRTGGKNMPRTARD